MRADQLVKLRELQEQLADVFIEEADISKWPGTDTRDSRGDRYWMKKNAQASLILVGRIENLLALRAGRTTGTDPTKADEAKLDDEIAAAEKEAARLGRNVVAIRRKKG